MKYPFVTAAVLLASMSAGAMAACTPDTQVTGADVLTAALQNNTLCSRRGTDRWQEYHQAGGAVIDYKRGPSDKVDPSKQVGTWSVSGAGARTKLTYNYGAGQSYNYTLHTNGRRGYSLCGGEGEILVTVRAGQVAC